MHSIPDELKQATNREAEVDRADALLGASDNRPVLLTGKRLVGKTAIIHEFVRRRMERRRSSETTVHAEFAREHCRSFGKRVAALAAAAHLRHGLRRAVGSTAARDS